MVINSDRLVWYVVQENIKDEPIALKEPIVDAIWASQTWNETNSWIRGAWHPLKRTIAVLLNGSVNCLHLSPQKEISIEIHVPCPLIYLYIVSLLFLDDELLERYRKSSKLLKAWFIYRIGWLHQLCFLFFLVKSLEPWFILMLEKHFEKDVENGENLKILRGKT